MQKRGTRKKTKTPESKCPWELGWSPLKSLNALPGRDAECYAKEYVGWESEKRWYRFSDMSVYSFVSCGHVE